MGKQERVEGIEVRFWGVRGSIASPGPETAGVGGTTGCVEVLCGGTRIILDAGTGLRRLGDALLAQEAPVEASLDRLRHRHGALRVRRPSAGRS